MSTLIQFIEAADGKLINFAVEFRREPFMVPFKD